MTMSTDSRRKKATDAAWSEWGRRHYRAIVGWQMFMTAAPFLAAAAGLAGLVYGVVWLWRRIPALSAPSIPGGGIALALLALLAVGAVLGGIAWYSPGAFRTGARKAFAALAAGGAAAAVWLWKGST